MPSTIDLYGLTKYRQESYIFQFLDTYVDRAAEEERQDEELMIMPIESTSGLTEPSGWDWEPARTLSHVIQRGLDIPLRAFTVYVASKHNSVQHAVISFTSDEQLILGLTINDRQKGVDTVAGGLLVQIMEQYRCHLGLIIAEMPPPSNQAEFQSLANHPRTILFHGELTLRD